MKKPLITAPGFYPDITPEQYFAEPCPEPALTASGITTLLTSCPAKFAYEHPAIGQPPEERASTAAQYLGSLVHRLALGKGADYAVSPYDEYRTAEAKAWRDGTKRAGRIPVKEKDFAAAEAMARVIRALIAEEMDGEDYETEVVIAWQRDGFWCRAMVDVWKAKLLRGRDVKTCSDASDRAITGAFARSYGRQHAWYADGLGVLTDRPGKIDFGFLFVESAPPHLTRLASATEGLRYGSMQECNRAFDTFAACMQARKWPGFAPIRIDPTNWQVRDWADAELEEAA